jgi:hypothetical protein
MQISLFSRFMVLQTTSTLDTAFQAMHDPEILLDMHPN